MKSSECLRLKLILDLLKEDYKHIWLALLGTVGFLGTLFVKGIFNFLIVLVGLLIVAEITTLGFLKWIIPKLAIKLENCKDFLWED